MNARIRELMELAMEPKDPYSLEGEFGPKVLNAEKFAELIVRRTLRVTGATTSQHQTALRCFGIEE